MTPADPMARALPVALEPIAKKLEKKLRKARKGDPDAVHDARTLLRRARVGLELMGRTAFEPICARNVANALRDIERALGPTRDDDVLLEHLEGWLERADARRRAQGMPLRARVRRRRAKHARTLARELERKPARAAMRDLRRLVEHSDRAVIPPPRNAARFAPTLVRHFIRHATWRAYEEALAYEAGPADDIDVIHKFRSACRRLRFTLELFEGATCFASSVVEPLHALQTRLGDLHDHAVAVARIQNWLSHARLPATSVIVDYVSARVRARDELLAEFGQERAAVTALSFRETLFRALDGHGGRAGHGGLRLVAGS